MNKDLKEIIIEIDNNIDGYLLFLDKYGWKWNSGCKPSEYVPYDASCLFLNLNDKDICCSMNPYQRYTIKVNENEYKLVDSLSKLEKIFIKLGIIKINYNKPSKLVYENKVLKFNEYIKR